MSQERRILDLLLTKGGSCTGAKLVPGRRGEETHLDCDPPSTSQGLSASSCPFVCHWGGARTWVFGVFPFPGRWRKEEHMILQRGSCVEH